MGLFEVNELEDYFPGINRIHEQIGLIVVIE
jgi:hypothetical protein